MLRNPVSGKALMLLAAAMAVSPCAATAGIHVEPYLQSPAPDGMTVLWWTDESVPANWVEYGQGGFDRVAAASNEYVPSMDKYLHEVRLTGLAPQTAYDYRVRSGSAVSGEYAFTTAVGRSSGFRVAVLGDGRTDDDVVIARHREVLRRAGTQDPSLVFELGDMVYEGYSRCWDDLYRRIVTATDVLDPGCDLGSRVPYHTVVGNHEIYSEEGYLGGLTTSMARYRAFASHPPNGSAEANWQERYYVLKYGCATFIVLDCNNTSCDEYDNHGPLPDGSTPDWQPGSEQYNWMIDQLRQARHDSAFTFVLMHPSPYSRGVHGTPDPMIDRQRGYELRVLDEVFRNYGVDAVLSSHDHTVEHCLTGPPGFEAAMNLADPANLNWLVQGNSGQSARPACPGWESWMDILGNDAAPFYSTWFYDWADTDERSFLQIEITPEGGGQWKAAFRTIQADGDVFDEFCLIRRDAPRYLTVAGDADVDGDVDRSDLLAVKRNFGAADATWAMGDFDGDGDVDAFDYVALKAGLRTPAGAAADRAASAPDPAALWLLALGSLALMRRDRRG